MSARAAAPGVYLVQAAAFCLLVGSWWAISGSGTLETQVNYLVLAVVALCVSLASCLGWLYVGRRRIALRRLQLAAQVGARFNSRATTAAPTVRIEFVSAASMTRYHHATCRLVRGKDVHPAARGAHEQAGRSACGVCRP
jgi:hypothetical protein